MTKKSPGPPLSNAVTYILLALAESDLHGYGIMQGALRLSGGQYKIGPGTLYDNLRTLLAAGVVDEVGAGEEGSESRRIYHLTKLGEGVLADELKRLEQVVKAGKSRLASARRRVV